MGADAVTSTSIQPSDARHCTWHKDCAYSKPPSSVKEVPKRNVPRQAMPTCIQGGALSRRYQGRGVTVRARRVAELAAALCWHRVNQQAGNQHLWRLLLFWDFIKLCLLVLLASHISLFLLYH